MLHETFKNRQDRQNDTKIILARPQILRNLKNVLYVLAQQPMLDRYKGHGNNLDRLKVDGTTILSNVHVRISRDLYFVKNQRYKEIYLISKP